MAAVPANFRRVIQTQFEACKGGRRKIAKQLYNSGKTPLREVKNKIGSFAFLSSESLAKSSLQMKSTYNLKTYLLRLYLLKKSTLDRHQT